MNEPVRRSARLGCQRSGVQRAPLVYAKRGHSLIQRLLPFGLSVVAMLPSCSEPCFTDVLSTFPSQDGRVIAATVVAAHGPMAGVVYAVTLSPAGTDPLRGTVVIEESDDDRPIGLHWDDAATLRMRLPCGIWSGLTNAWQSPDTHRIITIEHDPAEGCAPARP